MCVLGYARLHENITAGKADNHEGLDFYRPVEEPDRAKPLWGSNQWPTVPGFRERYEAWIEKMKALGLIVMEACVLIQMHSSIGFHFHFFLSQDGRRSRADN